VTITARANSHPITSTGSPTVAELTAELVAREHHVTPDGRVLDKAAAMVLGVTEGTLRNWRSQGKGPSHFRLGRIWYRLCDLIEYIERQRQEPGR